MSTTIYMRSNEDTPRLQYILKWIGQVLGIDFAVNQQHAENHLTIGYGINAGNIQIPDTGLLWQKGISKQEIAVSNWQSIPTLFAQPGYTIPFDIFSATFYLLSRYEEYLSYTPDKHNRYPHTESIMYQHGWMQRPLIDEWLKGFAQLLRESLGIDIPKPTFSFHPTYDIDIAWAYQNKGMLRQGGALLKSILGGRLSEAKSQLSVWQGRAKDPYDSFHWLQSLHQQYSVDAIFFILAALRTGPFDKNISPNHPQMQGLILSLKQYGQIGLHPSYHSNADSVFNEEQQTIQNIVQQSIHISRQHYIRFTLPSTYRQLIQRGITDDYSMGWTDTVGFRAGTSRSFNWYDLEQEQETSLKVHPFCFMDTAARFGMGWSATEAFHQLQTMKSKLEKTGSILTTIFHNFSLGTDKGWSGWSEQYAALLADINPRTHTNEAK